MKRSHSPSTDDSDPDELPDIDELPAPSTSGVGRQPRSRSDKMGKKWINIKEEMGVLFSKISDVCKGDYVVEGELKDAPIISIQTTKCDRGMSFPLDQKTAEDLANIFEISPYGLGEKTVVDQKFRNSLQLDPKDFTILNPAWARFVKNSLVNKIKTCMDIKEEFEAKLYKLLLYNPGSFFKRHKDSEKEYGMFGTLVVQLPSFYIGGQLVVYHANESKTVDFSSNTNVENGFKTYFAAFYADCEHEVLPIEKGIRVCLVYNLVLCKTKGKAATLLPQPPLPSEKQVVALITEWKKDPTKPAKLIYALSHQYTEKHLSFETLKPKDKPVAAMLRKLSIKHGFSCFLGMFLKETNIQGNEFSRRLDNSGDEDSDSFIEREFYLKQLTSIHAPTKGLPDIKQLTCSLSVDFEEEAIREDSFSDIKPHTVSQQPTGNEGIKKELHYQHAALVILPTPVDRLFDMMLENREWDSSYNDLIDIFLQQFFACRQDYSPALISNMLKRLVEKETAKPKDKLFEAVNELNDFELTKLYLRKYKICNLASATQITRACDSFGWKRLSEELYNMFKKDSVLGMGGKLKLELLEVLVGEDKLDADQKEACTNLFKMLLDFEIKRDKEVEAPVQKYSWSWPKTPQVEFDQNQKKKEYLEIVFRLGQKLNFDFSEFARDQPLKALIPVLMHELESNLENGYRDCLKKIGQHIATSLESVLDKPAALLSWVRRDYPNCPCNDCLPVRKFMESEEKELRMKVGKQRRMHIHQRLEYLKNITHVTERSGSPQTLVITKTGKSAAVLHQMAKSVLPDLKAALSRISSK